MIDHLDNLLRQLLISRVPEITDEAQVRFQPPDDAWRTYVTNLTVGGQPANALNVYLADVRENRTLRSNERVRSFSNGMVTDMPSPRRIDCHYLISAWSPATSTPTVEPTLDEHALLYQAAGALMTSEPLVPRKIYAPDPLPGTFPAVIADAELPTQLLPPEGFPKMAEFWGTFGTVHPWKPMLYLLVTLPVVLTEEIAGPMVTMRITEYRQSGSPQPGEIFAQIGGTITSAGQPVAGAWVRIEDTLGASIAATSTADDGRFTFGGLQPGTFVLRVRATGFTEATRTVDVPSASGNYDFQIT
jgi:hypothetical protein